jgi:hypothetical protein
MTIAAALFVFAIGAAFLLWGYRIFLVLIPVFGFFGGLWLGAHAVSMIFGDSFFATVTGLVVGIISGLVCAVLSYLFYGIAIFAIAAAIGYGLGVGFMQAIGVDATWIAVLVGILLAIGVVIATFWFNLQKPVVTALTAIAGANAIILSFLLLFGRVTTEAVATAGSAVTPVLRDSWFWLIVWIALAALGFVYQMRSNRIYYFTSDEYVTGWG